ncbi:DUF4075 domain-containing protein [Microbacteriaceae bacterium 4G12]
MKKKNNIVRNIAIGVAVGAAVSMFKKENRDKLASGARKAKLKMTEISKSPIELTERVKDKVQTVGTKGREFADFKIVKDKMEEIKKLTPAVMETIKETKEIFNKKKQQMKEKDDQELQAVSPGTEDLVPEKEPIVAEDGGMAEARELSMQHPVSDEEQETDEVVVNKDQTDEQEKKQTT